MSLDFLPPIRAYSEKEEQRVVDATEQHVAFINESGQMMRQFKNDYLKTLVDNNWPEEALWRVLEPRLQDEKDYLEFMVSIANPPFDPALSAKLLKVVLFYSPQDELLVHSTARRVAIWHTSLGFEDFQKTIDFVGIWSSQKISDAYLAYPLYACLCDHNDMILELAKLSCQYLNPSFVN